MIRLGVPRCSPLGFTGLYVGVGLTYGAAKDIADNWDDMSNVDRYREVGTLAGSVIGGFIGAGFGPGRWTRNYYRMGLRGGWSSAQGLHGAIGGNQTELAIADRVYRATYLQAKANGRRTTESAYDPATGTLRTRASGGGEPSSQADFPHLRFADPPLHAEGRPPGTCAMPRAAHDVIDAIGGVPTNRQIYVTQGGFFVNKADGKIWYRPPCENCGGLPGQPGTVQLNPALKNLPLPHGVPVGLTPGDEFPFTPPPHW